MKRSVQDTPVVFIGAGNLATNLAKALYQNGFRIVQVYSRTKEAACALAQAIEAEYTTELSEVSRDARLYIVSLKDAAFVELLPEIVAGKEDALLVHTAGRECRCPDRTARCPEPSPDSARSNGRRPFR